MTQYSMNEGMRELYIGMPIELGEDYDDSLWQSPNIGENRRETKETRKTNETKENGQGMAYGQKENGQRMAYEQNEESNWPIAMAYVPVQQWRSPYEDLGVALNVGTIFPELNLPLRGYAYKGGAKK